MKKNSYKYNDYLENKYGAMEMKSYIKSNDYNK